MKRLAVGFLLLLLFGSSRAQPEKNKIVLGTIDSLYSNILGETRAIWIFVPRGADAADEMKRYPVVYLLDGESHFYSVTGMIRELGPANGNTICPEMIVVGIPNTDRTRDLTPTHASGSPYLDNNAARTSGGGELFTEFLKKELMPYVDSHYPTAPYRLLIGHSIGGLMVVNTLFHHQELFNSYVAIDPSLWWDDRKLLKQAKADLRTNRYDGKTLFLAGANTMPESMDTSSVRFDTTRSTLHIRSILEFADALQEGPVGGLEWKWKYYDDDTHSSVPLIAEYDALRYIFSFYRLPTLASFSKASLKVDSLLISHFEEISLHMGFPVVPPEELVNQIGLWFFRQKRFAEARILAQLNIKNHPKSSDTHVRLGDCYVAEGLNHKALESYANALRVKEDPETRKKMEALEKVKQ